MKIASFIPKSAVRTSAFAVAVTFLSACGTKSDTTSPQQAKVQGLPSQDANIANLRSAFAKSFQVGSLAAVSAKSWSCHQFSAMKDIAFNSTFKRTFTQFGGLYVTEAAFNGVSSSGSVTAQGGVIRGGVTGTTDGFVFPYDTANIEIRKQADGTLIEEWTANPKAMVLSMRQGLALSALYADMWMAPAVSDASRVAFIYAVCKPL